MEKIKTPLQELYNSVSDNITKINGLLYGKKPQRNLNVIHDLSRKLMTLKSIKSEIKSLLPAERDMIEKVWINSQLSNLKSDHYWCDGEYENLEYLAQDYFTQTFESYE